MAADPESPLGIFWKAYSLVFRDFDDLTLARWLAQTLGQIEGKTWRLSHPLLGVRVARANGRWEGYWQKLALAKN